MAIRLSCGPATGRQAAEGTSPALSATHEGLSLMYQPAHGLRVCDSCSRENVRDKTQEGHQESHPGGRNPGQELGMQEAEWRVLRSRAGRQQC